MENHDDIANYDLPQEEQYICDLPVTVDKDSFAMLPSVATEGFLPVTTYADGNCLPRALSTIICGSESLHEEIRVRLTAELVAKQSLYIDPEFLALGTTDDGSALLSDIILFSDIPGAASDEPLHHLQAEVMRCRGSFKECGLFHIYAAASVLRVPIQCLCPEKGPTQMQNLPSRRMQPLLEAEAGPIFIMWTSTAREEIAPDDHWSPNHFVPLLRTAKPVDISMDDVFNTAFNERCVLFE